MIADCKNNRFIYGRWKTDFLLLVRLGVVSMDVRQLLGLHWPFFQQYHKEVSLEAKKWSATATRKVMVEDTLGNVVKAVQ